MRIKILDDHGLTYAVQGLMLSHGKLDFDQIVAGEIPDSGFDVASRLAGRDGGHNKFLESIVYWVLIDAPRYWWQEFDTYRVGVTKQSESTMHTITRRQLTRADFEDGIYPETLAKLNTDILAYQAYHAMVEPSREARGAAEEIFKRIKVNLPEGFLQTRLVCINAKSLRTVSEQRKTHRLAEWRQLINALKNYNRGEEE